MKLPDFWRNLPSDIDAATREGLDPIRAFAELLIRTDADAGRVLAALVASAEARLTRVRNRAYEGVWAESERMVKRKRAAISRPVTLVEQPCRWSSLFICVHEAQTELKRRVYDR